MATGGIGEAMLFGAITGAGTSAVTGGDPLKGALFGAMGGGLTSGISGALAGGAEGAAAASALPSAGATMAPGIGGDVGMMASGFGNTIGTAANPLTTGNLGSFGAVNTGGFGASALPGATGITGAGAPAGASLTSPMINPLASPDAGITAALPKTTGPFGDLKIPSTGDMLSRKDEIKTAGQGIADLIKANPKMAAAMGGGAANMLFNRPDLIMPGQEQYEGPLSAFRFNPYAYNAYSPIRTMADGGIAGTERSMYPQSQFDKTQYAVPSQMPTSAEVVASGYEPRVNPYTGEMGYASGGIADLGGYSDGGRLLKGPGDGMSDSIPARIGSRQPARLADGEFVVPADVVSHLGNGSTDAGAKQLYSMMDKVRRARTGNKKQGREINPKRFVPA